MSIVDIKDLSDSTLVEQFEREVGVIIMNSRQDRTYYQLLRIELLYRLEKLKIIQKLL